MTHRAKTIRARGRSMQAGGKAVLGLERIRHFRAESDEPEAARAFVVGKLQALPAGSVLEIEVGFDPSGFLDDLAQGGAHVLSRKLARRRWALLLQPPGDPELVDLCELESPLPMERILETAAELAPGQILITRTPCFPRPLLAQLDQRAADESALIWVRKPD